MSDWERVKWSDARQIVGLLDDTVTAGLGEVAMRPRAHFAALRAQSAREVATRYLGLALPRLETVAWAARTVRDAPGERTSAETQALRSALFWIQDPTEARRRAAGDAAESLAFDSPERFAALAVFYSGGSVSSPDGPPVLAPREAAGKFAAAAVLLAAARSGQGDSVLDQALDRGDRMANEGVGEANG